MSKVFDELQNAETVSALRVGKLVEWGGFLESFAVNEDTKREFGAMAVPYAAAVEKLKDLIRNHFAATLARFSALRDVRMEDGANPWDVLNTLRDIVAQVRSGSDGALPSLEAEDAEILDDIIRSIELRLRELEQPQSEDSRSSLRKDIDFQMAKAGATGGLYAEKARDVAGKSGQSADAILKWEKRGKGLWALLRAVREFLDM